MGLVFDLQNDPQEFQDLGQDAGYADVRQRMSDKLPERLTSRRNRVTMTDATVYGFRGGEDSAGIVIGKW